MRFLLLILPLILFSSFLQADEVTHQLGNSGYAVREAMQAGAAKKSPEHYWEAVRLQRQARILFSKRYIKKAVALSIQAEEEAKKALEESRD